MERNDEQHRLRKGDREYLRRLMQQTTNARIYRRVRAVLLIAEGSSVSEAAGVAGICRQSASRWLGIYRRDRRRCDFTEAKRSGRPPLEFPLSRLRAVLAQSPLELGYLSTGWTVSLLEEYLREHDGLSISDETLRRRLHALGYRWKRPRYIFTEPDPHRAQKKGASSVA